MTEIKEVSQPYLAVLTIPQGYKSVDVERLRLESKYADRIKGAFHLANRVSFQGNKTVPILRLYRYKEAFSLSFVQEFIHYFNLTDQDLVFDPFAGVGTTLFASMLNGIPSIGIDMLPIATFAADTLPKFLFLEQGTLQAVFNRLCQRVDLAAPAHVAEDVPLISLAFDKERLLRLRQWKAVIDRLSSPFHEIFLLLFLSILEQTSYTANDGQFLRLKSNKQTSEPDDALRSKVAQAEEDMVAIRQRFPQWRECLWCLPKVYLADARALSNIPFPSPPTAIITSPPYANRYDYTRSYCLELCFHFVKNFEELKAIRHGILRSHIESKVSPTEMPPHPAVHEVLTSLAQKKLNNPRIPFMLLAYFIDMDQSIRQWSKALALGGKVAMVVDNVRFEGELIPVDLVLSEMAEAAGFEVKEILIARYKGNSSQQMGKYGRIPVRESIVVWEKR